jgi:hypothetical protein
MAVRVLPVLPMYIITEKMGMQVFRRTKKKEVGKRLRVYKGPAVTSHSDIDIDWQL